MDRIQNVAVDIDRIRAQENRTSLADSAFAFRKNQTEDEVCDVHDREVEHVKGDGDVDEQQNVVAQSGEDTQDVEIHAEKDAANVGEIVLLSEDGNAVVRMHCPGRADMIQHRYYYHSQYFVDKDLLAWTLGQIDEDGSSSAVVGMGKVHEFADE